MSTTDIKALIDKYNLIRRGDKVGTYQTAGIDKAAFMRDVGAHKAEILAYFDAQEKAASDLLARRMTTFEGIPGVAELTKARAQRAEWQREFNRMMETGAGKMPYVEAPTPEEMAALEARYPMAVFALEAKYRAYNAVNDEILTIWTSAYDALCDGQNPEAVKAAHDKRMAEYTAAHIWD